MNAKWKPAVLAIAWRWSGGGERVVVSGDPRELSLAQSRHRLREGVAEIGVLGAAAVARPPTGVDRELHQAGQPADLLSAGRSTARQRAKPIEIDGFRAL